MEIIIVGAGIGGLSAALSLALAGHSVMVLESAPELAEIGAGVQLTPNATKSFWKWGLGPDILEHAALPGSFNIHKGANGQNMGHVPFKDFEAQYGGPYLVIHRADIHRILHKHAIGAGVQLKLNRRVIKYNFEAGGVQLANGKELQADLVVAADGIKSFARDSFLGEMGDGLEKTGWAAYRAMAPVDTIKANPDTAHLVTEHKCNCWIGDGKLIMAYMVKNTQMLNIVLSHLDDVDTSKWNSEQYKSEVNRLFKNWDPPLVKLLSMINSDVLNWPIYQVKSLPKWTSKSGKFVLMGDAAHAMAFYLSMGVSMAVEDAEALTECISLQQSDKSSLAQAMTVFEKVRKPRVEAVRDASLHAGETLQLSQGPGQEARDRSFKDDGRSAGLATGDDFYVTRNSYGIADKVIRDWCYGYNAVDKVQAEWR